MKISFLQQYLDLNDISVKTTFHQSPASSHHAKESSQASQELCTTCQGGHRSLHTPMQGHSGMKSQLTWGSTGWTPTSCCHPDSPNQSCLLQLSRRTAEKPVRLWKLPAAIAEECKAVYKHTTRFSSQCPDLREGKKCNCSVVLEVPLIPFCKQP